MFAKQDSTTIRPAQSAAPATPPEVGGVELAPASHESVLNPTDGKEEPDLADQ